MEKGWSINSGLEINRYHEKLQEGRSIEQLNEKENEFLCQKFADEAFRKEFHKWRSQGVKAAFAKYGLTSHILDSMNYYLYREISSQMRRLIKPWHIMIGPRIYFYMILRSYCLSPTLPILNHEPFICPETQLEYVQQTYFSPHESRLSNTAYECQIVVDIGRVVYICPSGFVVPKSISFSNFNSYPTKNSSKNTFDGLKSLDNLKGLDNLKSTSLNKNADPIISSIISSPARLEITPLKTLILPILKPSISPSLAEQLLQNSLQNLKPIENQDLKKEKEKEKEKEKKKTGKRKLNHLYEKENENEKEKKDESAREDENERYKNASEQLEEERENEKEMKEQENALPENWQETYRLESKDICMLRQPFHKFGCAMMSLSDKRSTAGLRSDFWIYEEVTDHGGNYNCQNSSVTMPNHETLRRNRTHSSSLHPTKNVLSQSLDPKISYEEQLKVVQRGYLQRQRGVREDIRCSHPTLRHKSTSTITSKMGPHKQNDKLQLAGQQASVKMQFLGAEIPPTIIFFALGETNLQNIPGRIAQAADEGKWYPEVFRSLIFKMLARHPEYVKTQMDAWLFIADQAEKTSYSLRKKIVYAQQFIKFDLYPHIGLSFKYNAEKLFLHAHIQWRMLMSSCGFGFFDSKDLFRFQQWDTNATMWSSLERMTCNKIHVNADKMLKTLFSTNKMISSIDDPLGLAKEWKNIINETKMNDKVASALAKGVWTIQTQSGPARVGATLSMKTTNFYTSTGSALRRANTANARNRKFNTARMLEPTQAFSVCAFQTPEGNTFGLARFLCQGTVISLGCSRAIIFALFQKFVPEHEWLLVKQLELPQNTFHSLFPEYLLISQKEKENISQKEKENISQKEKENQKENKFSLYLSGCDKKLKLDSTNSINNFKNNGQNDENNKKENQIEKEPESLKIGQKRKLILSNENENEKENEKEKADEKENEKENEEKKKFKYRLVIDGKFECLLKDGRSILQRLREWRRQGIISKHVSLILEGINLYVNVLPGQSIRPLWRTKGLVQFLSSSTSSKTNNFFQPNESIEGEQEQKQKQENKKEMVATNLQDLEDQGLIDWIRPDELQGLSIAFSVDDFIKRSKLGERFSHIEFEPSWMLGLNAGSLPFLNYNHAPRAIIGSNILNQPFAALVNPYKINGQAHVLHYPQRPICQTRSLSDLNLEEEVMTGQMVELVIYAHDKNQEDSQILNHDHVQRGLLRTEIQKRYSCAVKNATSTKKEVFEIPNSLDCVNKQEADYSKINPKTGMPDPGTVLSSRDIIISKVIYEEKQNNNFASPSFGQILLIKKDDSMVFKEKQGKVIEAREIVCSNGTVIKEVIVQMVNIPELGDKNVVAVGQKGTNGYLPKERDSIFSIVTGNSPGLIMNPLGIGGRQTIGLLHEQLRTQAASILGEFEDATAFLSDDEKKSNLEIASVLLEHGIHNLGYQRYINGVTGELTQPLLCGQIYIRALEHLVSKKDNARNMGPVTTTTRQAQEGRAKDGGLRWGFMEVECVLSLGGTTLNYERLGRYSDHFLLPICGRCGGKAYLNAKTPVYKFCTVCQNGDNVFLIDSSYIMNVYHTDNQALTIDPKFVLQDLDADARFDSSSLNTTATIDGQNDKNNDMNEQNKMDKKKEKQPMEENLRLSQFKTWDELAENIEDMAGLRLIAEPEPHEYRKFGIDPPPQLSKKLEELSNWPHEFSTSDVLNKDQMQNQKLLKRKLNDNSFKEKNRKRPKKDLFKDITKPKKEKPIKKTKSNKSTKTIKTDKIEKLDKLDKKRGRKPKP